MPHRIEFELSLIGSECKRNQSPATGAKPANGSRPRLTGSNHVLERHCVSSRGHDVYHRSILAGRPSPESPAMTYVRAIANRASLVGRRITQRLAPGKCINSVGVYCERRFPPHSHAFHTLCINRRFAARQGCLPAMCDARLDRTSHIEAGSRHVAKEALSSIRCRSGRRLPRSVRPRMLRRAASSPFLRRTGGPERAHLAARR